MNCLLQPNVRCISQRCHVDISIMLVILCEPPANSALITVRAPHVSSACANSLHSSRVSPLVGRPKALFVCHHWLEFMGPCDTVGWKGTPLPSLPFPLSLSHNWIHLLWEAGRDCSPCCPSPCGGQKSSFSPQQLKKRKEQKICPWLDKRLTLCHVRSCYNEQTGSVHRWELCEC